MKIALTSIGSRGDIQPYIALGCALQSCGHVVRLVTHPWVKPLATSYGLSHVPIGNDIDINYVAKKFVENSTTNLQSFKFALSFIFESLRNCHSDLIQALKSADLVIGHGIVGKAESEILDKPFVTVSIAPMGLEKVHWKSKNLIKETAGVISDIIGEMLFGQPYIKYRKDLGLPAKSSDTLHPYLALIPISPCLQKHNPNWKPVTEITGYFFANTPETFSPPRDLQQFLHSGEKPVLVTFGSMFHRKEETDVLFKTITSAISESRSRGLILMPDVSLQGKELPDEILVIDNIPYSWLLNQVGLVIHHFGFGTTAEVLKAGLPAIPVPHIFDQKIRANQLYKRGYAFKPLNKNKLTSKMLSEAISSVKENKEMIEQCSKVGEEITKEHGIETAVNLINRMFK